MSLQIQYQSNELTLNQEPEYGFWVGSFNHGEIPIAVELDSEYPSPREQQLHAVGLIIERLLDQGLDIYYSKIWDFFQIYRENSLETGNIWAEDFEGIKGIADMENSIESYGVFSFDGVLAGLTVKTTLECRWYSPGGVSIEFDESGKFLGIFDS
ncbi:MAG: hypothetical protein AAGH99_09995 [Planctomycetota bacterium]